MFRMDSVPSCQVCHEHFTLKGPIPYLLPCLHPVCETCVTSTAGGLISCSTCQREVNLTETHLQKDLVRQRQIFHLTVQHRPSELLCTHEDDGNQAVCWCQECQKFFCEYCQNVHDGFEATRIHTVLRIGDVDPGVLSKIKYCSFHKKYKLEFWDKHCKTFICAGCRLSDHATHNVDDIDGMAGSAEKDIKEHKKKMETMEQRQNSLTDDTKKQARNYEAQSQELTEKINHVVNTLKADLDQIGKEMVIDLEQQTSKMSLSLNAQCKELQRSHTRCKSVAEYIKTALMYSSKYDLINLRAFITETTQMFRDSASESVQHDTVLPKKYTERLERMRTRIFSQDDDDDDNDGDDDDDKTKHNLISTGRPLLGNQSCQTEPEKEVNSEKEEKSDHANIQKEERKTRRMWSIVVSGAILLLAVSICYISPISNCKTEQVPMDMERQWCENNMHRSLKNRFDYSSLQKKTTGCEETCKKTLVNLGVPEGVTPYLLISGTRSVILHCINLGYDKNRVNLFQAQVNNEGYLVNRPGSVPRGDNKDSFKYYCGTCSNAPIPQTGSPVYLEVRASVHIIKPLPQSHLILQIGLCRKMDRDVEDSLPKRSHTYWMELLGCYSHNSVCLKTVKNGYEVDVVRDAVPNTAGSHVILHYGVLYDEARSKIIFIDVNGNKIISVFKNIDVGISPWPMFGVYNRHYVEVEMKLVAGEDIEMTNQKKGIILKGLMQQNTQLESGSAYGSE